MPGIEDEEGGAVLRDALDRVQAANQESFEILERFARGAVEDPALDISHVLRAHLKSLLAAEKVLKILVDRRFAQRLSSLN